MTFKRADRVAELIMAELSRIILRDVRDPRVRNVTITDVKVSDDLRNAKIYFVPLGESAPSDEVLNGLQKAIGFLRRELGKKLQLRYVPKIEFFIDESFAYGDRIEKLLAEIHKVDIPDDGENC